MKHFSLTLIGWLSLVSVVQAHSPSSSDLAIIGGSQDQEHHFLIGLVDEEGRNPFCGATVIEPGLAITAGHCLKMRSRDLWLVGATDWSRRHFEATRVKVREIEIHPDYLRGDHSADIALVRYEATSLTDEGHGMQPIPIKVEQPAVLPESAQVLGWGSRSSYGNLEPDSPQVATVPLVADDVCRGLGGRYSRLSSAQLCAGYLQDGGIDSCHGDSGGPLFATDSSGGSSLIGVVSWGESCAQAGQPGVYTRIASFLDWINASRARRPPITVDPTSEDFRSLVNRRCYHRLHAKLKETSGDNVLNLFTHVLEVKSIRANEDSSDHLLGEPTCAIDTDGGNYDLHFAAIDRERPEQQLGILVESATGRKFQVAINTSLRVQLSCQLVAPINGDPMLVADDEKVVVRWHGQFYEALIDDLQSDNQLPGEEAPKGSGCAVGPFAVHVMAKTNANADEAIVAAITIPNSKNAQKRILLKRVERAPFMQINFIKRDDHSGFIELHNPTKFDLLNWRLECNHHLTFEALSSWPAARDFEEGSYLSHEYSSRSLAWSRVPRGSTLRFAYRSESSFGLGAKIGCTINGIPMTVTESQHE